MESNVLPSHLGEEQSSKKVAPPKKKANNFEISTFNPPESLTFSVKSHSKRSIRFADLPKEGRLVLDEGD